MSTEFGTPLGYLDRVLLEWLPVPVLAANDSGLVVQANSALERVLGYAAGGFEGRLIAELFAPESVASGPDAVTRLHECAGTVVELRHREGFVVWAALSRSVRIPTMLVSIVRRRDS
ncbi:PAS domain-containing protein [Rhodococcus koreensis]